MNKAIVFERYVNFEFYKQQLKSKYWMLSFERYVNFEFYKHVDGSIEGRQMFERYVNFEFYKQLEDKPGIDACLRDM